MNLMVLPLWAWIVFYVLVLFMLVADLIMFGKKGQHEVRVGEALKMTAVWIGVSLLFCAGIYFFYPGDSHEMALEFLAGYLIVAVYGQSVCVSHVILVLRHRAQVSA